MKDSDMEKDVMLPQANHGFDRISAILQQDDARNISLHI